MNFIVFKYPLNHSAKRNHILIINFNGTKPDIRPPERKHIPTSLNHKQPHIHQQYPVPLMISYISLRHLRISTKEKSTFHCVVPRNCIKQVSQAAHVATIDNSLK